MDIIGGVAVMGNTTSNPTLTDICSGHNLILSLPSLSDRGLKLGIVMGLLLGGGRHREGTFCLLFGVNFSLKILFSQTALYKAWREESLPYMLAYDDDTM